MDIELQKRLYYLQNEKDRKKQAVEFIVCPFCGYNNESRRFAFYGTCLRCHKIIDKKIYLKRRIWEDRMKYKMKG